VIGVTQHKNLNSGLPGQALENIAIYDGHKNLCINLKIYHKTSH